MEGQLDLNAGALNEATIRQVVDRLRGDRELRGRFTDALRQDFVATAERTFNLTPEQREALNQLTGVPQDALALFIHSIALALELGQAPTIELSTTTVGSADESAGQRREVRAACNASGEAKGKLRWSCTTSISFAWE